MSPYRYFVRKGELPTPQDTGLKAHTITEANKRVNGILTKHPPTNEAGTLRKRRYTATFTAEDREKIRKYAAENGNASAVKHFKQAHPGLGESIVRYLKKPYYEQGRSQGWGLRGLEHPLCHAMQDVI